MVEVIEYLLVFGITISLSAFSILILGGSLPMLGQTQARAQMDQITGAADLAALKGNSTLILPLTDASITCSQGVMSLSSGGQTFSSPVSYPCDFQYSSVTCLCRLVFFVQDRDVLGLRVES